MAIDSSYEYDEIDPMDRKGDFGSNFGGSFGLHLAIVGSIVLSLWWSHRLHGNNWGDATTGAIQASLVSSAPSVPLPSIAPPTKNVLATETPSPAPAIPEKASVPAPDLSAVQIPVKQTPPKPKPLPEKPQPPQEQKHPQEPPQQHRANYGEQQAANMPKSMANTPNASASPVQVAGGDFGSRFGYYVNGITRTVSQNWYKQEVDPGTRKAPRPSSPLPLPAMAVRAISGLPGPAAHPVSIPRPSGPPSGLIALVLYHLRTMARRSMLRTLSLTSIRTDSLVP